MKKIHVIDYIVADIEAVEEDNATQKDGALRRRIFISPKDAEIISASITADEVIQKIVPSQCDSFKKENNGLFELMYAHISVEVDRCFERIEFREISGPIKAEWVKFEIQPSVLYWMRYHPKQFCMDLFM